VAGPLIDRFGARTVAAVGGTALAAGYAGLAFAHAPVPALVAGALAGAGNGALNPSQSALVATLTPARLRHRGTAVARVATNVGIGLGGGLGGLVAAYGPTGFVALFLANSLSYLVYVGVLIALVRDPARAQGVAGGYRTVLRDRVFGWLVLTNVAMIAVGWGTFTWLVPPYARAGLGLGARPIGVLLLANAATVALVQVPVARLAEGRRRGVLMALAAGLFLAACALVLAAGRTPGRGYPLLLTASILVAVGECCHTTVLVPLTADLAPPGLRGRYIASMALSWWVGLAAAPVLGAPLLGVRPTAVFATAALVALAAGTSALALDRALPEGVRTTPVSAGTGEDARASAGP